MQLAPGPQVWWGRGGKDGAESRNIHHCQGRRRWKKKKKSASQKHSSLNISILKSGRCYRCLLSQPWKLFQKNSLLYYFQFSTAGTTKSVDTTEQVKWWPTRSPDLPRTEAKQLYFTQMNQNTQARIVQKPESVLRSRVCDSPVQNQRLQAVHLFRCLSAAL